MKIAIIGTGSVGLTLGKKWIQKKHEVVFGSRSESIEKNRAKLLSLNLQVEVDTIQSAISGVDVIVLAVPYEEGLKIAELIGDISGKTIIDVMNPFTADFSGIKLGFSTSGAEEVQKRVPKSHVVKAFNHYGVKVTENPQFGMQKAVLYYCGSDKESLKFVGQLVDEVGYDGVGINNLEFARVLEPLALVWMSGIRQFGVDHALGLLKH